jgi:putative peptidoglycan lipid II flippase
VRIARLAVIAGIAKGPGFLIPVIIAAFFGAGPLTDAYFLAYGGVLLVGGTVGQPMEAAIVPFAAHALSLGREAANRFMRGLIRQGAALGMAATLLAGACLGAGLLLSRPQGLHASQVFLFYAILAPGAVAWCVAGVITGSLVSGWHLEAGAIGYGFRGVGALSGALVGASIRELWPVAVGVSAGECSRVWWLRSRWRRVLGGLPVGTGGQPERGFLAAALHQMTAQGLLAGSQFLERFLVGTVAVAAISHVEYAYRMLMVAAVIFDGGVGPWLLARWSNARIGNRLSSDWAMVYRPVALAAAVALGASAAIALAAPVIVTVVLHHGAFTQADALTVTHLLQWYAIGYFFNMSALCVERLLLARAQNRMFLGLAALRVGVRIGAILALLTPAGVLALPIAYATAEALYVSGLLYVSRREGLPVTSEPVHL